MWSDLNSQKALITVSSHDDLVAKAKDITKREMELYSQRTHHSQIATERARKVMPAGVPSSFQAYDPWPVVVKHASGSKMIDVDDNEYVDYDMGFGALFAGHMNPAVRAAVMKQLDDGTLYVTPCELNADVGELLAERYGLPMWRPTNSGTEATMDAIRLARGATGREKLVDSKARRSALAASRSRPVSPRARSTTSSSSRTTTPRRSTARSPVAPLQRSSWSR